jgi:hypothetical protein
MNSLPASVNPHPGGLQMILHPRVPLVKMDTVIAARGEPANVIHAHWEQGRLRWVFNLAPNPAGIRDLRFWSREISVFAANARAELTAIRHADPASVVNEILGWNECFRPTDVCLLLGIRRPTLALLRHALQAERTPAISRRGLEQFLKRRLLSN